MSFTVAKVLEFLLIKSMLRGVGFKINHALIYEISVKVYLIDQSKGIKNMLHTYNAILNSLLNNSVIT